MGPKIEHNIFCGARKDLQALKQIPPKSEYFEKDNFRTTVSVHHSLGVGARGA